MKNQQQFLKVFVIVFGSVGGFLVLGAVLAWFLGQGRGGDEELAGRIVAYTFSGLGVAFLLTAGICQHLASKLRLKETRLKELGQRYEGEIANVRLNPTLRWNRQCPVVVECTYKHRDGNVYLVKSGNIWLPFLSGNPRDLQATVWVNPENPQDYVVEVHPQSGGVAYDMDLR